MNLVADGEHVDALDQKPELPEDVMTNWDLFWTLSSKRTMGFDGPNPISMSEIESCMRVFEINRWREKMRFMHNIGIMDQAYIKFCYSKKPKASK